MKNIRLSISSKLSLGFGVIILVTTAVFYLTASTLYRSREINARINDVISPSLSTLENLDNNLTRSQYLIKQWALIQSREDDLEKTELISLVDQKIPAQIAKLRQLSDSWNDEDRTEFSTLCDTLKLLINVYGEIRALLPNHASYTIENMMRAEDYFIQGYTISIYRDRIKHSIDHLKARNESEMRSQIIAMNESFNTLRLLLVNIAIIVIVAGILIAFFTSRSIVRPVNSLRRKLVNLGQGIYSIHPVKAGNDEIGDMAGAVSRLVENLEKTKEFSTQVGSGNFNVPFAPLSEYDELGQALLRMRADLSAYRDQMERLVREQTGEIRHQKEQVEEQREKVTLLYTDLQASIRYAQRLQEAILPGDEYIHTLFPDSFVLFRPKATVSGDFYWFRMQGGKKIFAAADCTGHGVPGAFMSLVGHNVLNQVTKVFTRPSQILNNLNRMSAEMIHSHESEHMRDGMDVALCTFDPETMELEYSGAHNPIYIIQDGEFSQLESDPFSIGSFNYGEKEYTNHSMQLKKGDCIYLFSDGFADQFGGPQGKKFMRKQFRMTLILNTHLPMSEQQKRLEEALDQWKGEHEQVDDILVMGIRI